MIDSPAITYFLIKRGADIIAECSGVSPTTLL